MSMTREEAEALYISAVLHDNDVVGQLDLVPDMFTTYRPIYERILRLMENGSVKKSDLLIGGSEKITQLVSDLNPWSSANWEFYANEIRKGWKKQVIEEACKVATGQEPDQAMETLENAFDTVQQRDIGAKTKTLKETLLPTLKKIFSGKDSTGLLSGLSTIDACTLGFRKSQFIVIGARPSQGKSALMQGIARHIAKTDMVGIISIESDEEELTTRMISSEASVDSRVIISGSLDPGHTGRIRDAAVRLEAIQDRIYIHDQGDLNWNAFTTVARRMVKKGCKILFVDYLQLIEFPGAKTKTEEVSTVSRKTKALAKRLKVPIVALAQLGRDADERRPIKSDFQHSSSIEQDADALWMIWHPPKDKDGKQPASRIILDKVRDGMTRDVLVKFDRPTLSFYELEKDDEQN